MTTCISCLSLLLALTVQAPGPSLMIDSARIRRHVSVLAHDSLGGRDTPSPGLEAAARYIIRTMTDAGVEPLGDRRTYLQRWPYIERALIGSRVAARLGAGPRPAPLRYGADFFFISAGAPSIEGPVVFRGAIDRDTAPDRSVRGRVVAYTLRSTDWFGPVHQAIRRLRSVGATAALIVLDSRATPANVSEIRVAAEGMEHTSDAVPAIAVRRQAAAERFREAGYDLATMERTARPEQLERLRVIVEAPIQADTTVVPNVVGVVPGADPLLRDEYVVVSSHFDHLGFRPQSGKTDSIYNGADDNASGTAALLEIARELARSARPRRSVIFLAVSGEEKGILGSKYFVQHPPVPLERVVANVNLDGIGRAWQRDTVSVVGGPLSTLALAIERASGSAPWLKLTVVDDQWPDRGYLESSDQIRFAEAGIPSVFFSSAGPHRDYHRPSDELGGLMAEFTARVATLAALTVLEVANAPDRPRWTERGSARFTKRLPTADR